jgi:hypothetical protein
MAEQRKADRVVALLFGVFFSGIAVAVVLLAQPLTTGAAIAAGVLGLLGLEAVVAALRGRRALLSRIGPLP